MDLSVYKGQKKSSRTGFGNTKNYCFCGMLWDYHLYYRKPPYFTDYEYFERDERIDKWWVINCDDTIDVMNFIIEAGMMEVHEASIQEAFNKFKISDTNFEYYCNDNNLQNEYMNGTFNVCYADENIRAPEVIKGNGKSLYWALVDFFIKEQIFKNLIYGN
jgi:hypothetical protein